jgi:hypothetical protein
LEKKDLKEPIALNITLNKEKRISLESPPLSADDFPQVFKPSSSLEKEHHGPSFASMTKKAPSPLPAFTPSRKSPNRLIVDENENEFTDSAGWTLDLEGMALDDENAKSFMAVENAKSFIPGKKKVSKKTPILSNGSLRRRT